MDPAGGVGYNGPMIGILSDSHDNLIAVRRAVRVFEDARCDLVLHAGDFIAPFAALELRALSCPVKAVFGNCDGEKRGLIGAFQGMGKISEPPFLFEHAGRSFRLAHLNAPMESFLAKAPCDVFVFGHTHRPEVRRHKGVLLINPGETGGWLHGKSTIVLLDPADLAAEVVTL